MCKKSLKNVKKVPKIKKHPKNIKNLHIIFDVNIPIIFYLSINPKHLLSLIIHLTNHIVKSQLHSSLSSHPATQFSFQLFLRQNKEEKIHPSEGKARNWIMEASKNHEYFIIIPPSIDTSLKAQKASSLYTDLHFVPLFFSLWEARSLSFS